MSFYFIGSLFPRNRIIEFSKNSKKFGLDNAANNFQWALLRGAVNYFDHIEVISQPALQSYPGGYKKLLVKGSDFVENNKLIGRCIGYFNVFPFSHVSKFINIFKYIKKIISKKDTTIVLVYAISTPVLASIYLLKKTGWKNIKFCLVVPDLPQYMYETNNPFYLILKKIDCFFIDRFLKQIDSFVLLTKYMSEGLPLYGKPYVVVEGIYDYVDVTNHTVRKVEDFTFMYSGSLHKRFGILNLIRAFQSFESTSVKLWICGSGDALELVKEASKNDNRITYLGELLHSEVLSLQKKVTVLINPRNSKAEYTRYSFPSKTLEYFVSGTPAIIHRLPGIPDEYYDYCYCPVDDSVSALAQCMNFVFSRSREELKAMGLKAKKFVLLEKNCDVQFKKINDLFSNS